MGSGSGSEYGEMGAMKVWLSRWVCLDVDSNLRRFRDEVARAAAEGAEMVVFPELFLTGYTRALEPERAWEIFAEVSKGAPELLMVLGSISEGRRNRVTAWSGGRELAAYDKVHLFRPNREHEMWDPGDRYVAFRWRDRCIGLMNCNDVRFPEQARALKLRARCDLLVVPAWWPWRRDHVWRTLLRARAIENHLWVVGCAVSGSVSPGEEFAGAGNHVFDPLGEPLRTADDCAYVLDLDNPPAAVVDPAEQYVDVDRVEVFED
jgi:predicted amidohydrolase